MLILSWAIWKQGIRLTFSWEVNDSVKETLSHYMPLTVGLFLGYSISLVGGVMAASLESGSVAALNFGKKLVDPIIGIVIGAISTAIFPYISKMIAGNSWNDLINTLKFYTRWIVAITLPITIIIYFFSSPIVRIFFERGEFKASDTLLVASVQAMYVLRLPFLALNEIGFRLLSALKENKMVMEVLAWSLAVSIIFNIVLMKYMGVAGLALSVALATAFSTMLIFFKMRGSIWSRIKNNAHGTSADG